MGMFKDEDRLKTVYVGQVVIAPYANGADGAGIKCVVTSMTDSSAFVKNIKHKYVRWFAINELYPYDDRVKQHEAELKKQKQQPAKEPF